MFRLPVHHNTIVQVTKIKNTFLSKFLFDRILHFPNSILLELLFYLNFNVQKISLSERFLVILKNKQMFTFTRFIFYQMTILFRILIFTEKNSTDNLCINYQKTLRAQPFLLMDDETLTCHREQSLPQNYVSELLQLFSFNTGFIC